MSDKKDKELAIELDSLKDMTSVSTVESKEEVDEKKDEDIKKEEGIDVQTIANVDVEDKTDKDDRRSDSLYDELRDVKKENTSDSKVSDNVYKTFAKTLKEQGILERIDIDKIESLNSVDDVVELVRKEIEEKSFSGLNDLQKEALKAMKNGIPIELFTANKARQEAFSQITDEDLSNDTDLQKQLIREDFKLRGFSDEKIDKLIAKFEDFGDLEEEAKDSLNRLKEVEEKRLEEYTKKIEERKRREEEERERRLSELKDRIYKTDEYIKGLKVPQSLKDKIFKSMTTPVKYDANNNPMNIIAVEREKDPIDFEMRLHYLFHITKGFKDFSILKNATKTSAIRELDEELKNAHLTPEGKPKSITTSSGKKFYEALKNIDISKY